MSQAHTNLGNGRVEALEQRVHCLESAVAAFQDTRQLEDRLVERVLVRLPPPAEKPSAITLDMRRATLPAARPAVTRTDPNVQTWLPLEIFQDARAILRMFFDYRYRTSRWVGVISIGVMAGLLVSWFLISYIPLAGPILSRIVDLVLLFVLFKILTREARRYRSMIPD
jgi:hypothetical protein